MNKNFRELVEKNLNSKDTEELLDIWEHGDPEDWDEGVFEILETILTSRIGSKLPPISLMVQISNAINNIEQLLEDGDLKKALIECNHLISLSPNMAIAYNYRGEIYEDMDQLENAIVNYQKACQLNPEFKEALDSLLSVETELEDEFQNSAIKQRLDQALEFAYNEEPEKALEECEAIKLELPNIAIAHNYFGMILETLNQVESAIDSYAKAVEMNPKFYAARENLANAKVKLEEDFYHQIALERQSYPQVEDISTSYNEDEIPDDIENEDPIPGWVYLDEKAFILKGWAGHRNRSDRSGYDPIDRAAEQGHVQGVVFRALINGHFRTRHRGYLLLMTFFGILYSLSTIIIIPSLLNNWRIILFLLISPQYWIIGFALLKNVYLSLQLEKSSESEDNGYTFF